MRYALVFLLGVLSSTAFAQSSGKEPKTETTYKPLYNSGNHSFGGYGSTTTQGGYSTGGSGQAIPDGTRGSTQSSSGGAMYQYRFK